MLRTNIQFVCTNAADMWSKRCWRDGRNTVAAAHSLGWRLRSRRRTWSSGRCHTTSTDTCRRPPTLCPTRCCYEQRPTRTARCSPGSWVPVTSTTHTQYIDPRHTRRPDAALDLEFPWRLNIHAVHRPTTARCSPGSWVPVTSTTHTQYIDPRHTRRPDAALDLEFPWRLQHTRST